MKEEGAEAKNEMSVSYREHVGNGGINDGGVTVERILQRVRKQGVGGGGR